MDDPADAADTFRTVARAAEVETKVLGSRFIGRAWPVASERAASDLLDRLRRAEHRATHHCSAFRLGPDGRLCRAHDDGEPSGTAGLPILRQIDAAGLTDVLVVVTRYYGGTKLGTGGLVRAYGESARLALDAAGARDVIVRRLLTVRFDYADTAAVLHTLGRFDARTEATRYTDVTEVDVAVRASEAEALGAALSDALGGRAWRVEPPGG